MSYCVTLYQGAPFACKERIPDSIPWVQLEITSLKTIKKSGDDFAEFGRWRRLNASDSYDNLSCANQYKNWIVFWNLPVLYLLDTTPSSGPDTGGMHTEPTSGQILAFDKSSGEIQKVDLPPGLIGGLVGIRMNTLVGKLGNGTMNISWRPLNQGAFIWQKTYQAYPLSPI